MSSKYLHSAWWKAPGLSGSPNTLGSPKLPSSAFFSFFSTNHNGELTSLLFLHLMWANPLLIGLCFLSLLFNSSALRTPLKRSRLGPQKTPRSAISRTRLGHGLTKSPVLNAANDTDNTESLACVYCSWFQLPHSRKFQHQKRPPLHGQRKTCFTSSSFDILTIR